MRRNLLTLFLFGVGLGLFTSFGQTYLPDPLTQLANAYSIWLLCAFTCGALVSRYRWAIISGAIIQYLALATYYVLIHVRFEDLGFNVSSNIIWLVGGTLAGPVAGLCGKLYANHSKYSDYSIAFIVAVILSESLFNVIQLHYLGEGIVFAVLAVVAILLLLKKYPTPKGVVVPLIVMTLVLYVGYAYAVPVIFN